MDLRFRVLQSRYQITLTGIPSSSAAARTEPGVERGPAERQQHDPARRGGARLPRADTAPDRGGGRRGQAASGERPHGADGTHRVAAGDRQPDPQRGACDGRGRHADDPGL